MVSLRSFNLLNVALPAWLALFAGAALAVPAENPPLSSPYLREAEYYRHQSQPLFALASLLAAQKQDLLDQDRNAVELLLGQLYRDYELPGQATDSLQRASGAGVGSLRGKAWWELAVRRYQRADYARAKDALARSTGLLPYELEKQRPLLQAQILLALNRNAEAAALLNAWQPIQEQDPYTRYNIGVALVRDGDLLQGAGMLDSVGTMPAPTAELLALRDQANLAMGYGFLRADHGATARPLLKRVQLDGPYSNLALLGAGWAELAPDGARQQNLFRSPVGCVEDPARVLPESLLILRRPPRGACDHERTFKTRVFFDQAPGAGTETERYRRALIPWQTLIRRNPADPAVQEALLAVPYAFSRLKGTDQAVEHYRNAISHYESERQHLQRSTALIRETAPQTEPAAGKSAQPSAWSLPRPEDMRFLGSLMASDHFQATLRDLQAMRQLNRALKPMLARLVSLESRLDGSAEVVAMADASATPQSGADEGPAAFSTENAATERSITYFGVFDYLPSSNPVDADSITASNGATVPESTESIEAESQPVSSRRRTQPAADGETAAQRHARLRARLDALQTRVAAAEREHERVVRDMALAEIANQQERLDTYLAQARFSLARLLDPAMADSTGQ